MAEARLLHDARATIGESPLWQDGIVRWTDPLSRRLLLADDGGWRAVAVDAALWSLAALPGGGVAGSLDDRLAGVRDDGLLAAGPAADVAPGCRFNDMAVGADGALWVGAMHRGLLATRGTLYRAGSIEDAPVPVAKGLGVPNGMALAADGRTLYVIDTLARTLLAYPVAGAALGEPHVVTDFLDMPGKPDGMTIADDGALWVAMWGGGYVVEIAPDGAPLRRFPVPAPQVGSLCFAGSARLLVSTARMRLSPERLAAAPGSGGLFEILLDTAP